ncbi:MAG: TOPRIM nucleotidyl transferase/hydrolase domain-containing protein [Actinomycetota bacterium]
MTTGSFAAIDASARTVVLVEGVSDRRALETLAARRRHDLASAGVAIVAMGGSKNVRYAVDRFGPRRAGPEAGRARRRTRGGRLPARARAGRAAARSHASRSRALRLLRLRGGPRGRADTRARSGTGRGDPGGQR